MKIGFIDYYLDEWHANNYPRFIDAAGSGRFEIDMAYGDIDSPIGGRTTDKWCADMGIPRARTIEEVVEKCDRLIVLSPDNCEQHERLCQIPLSSGKPTYVDKTFAPDYPTAKRIFDVAEASGTPCYSSSALRFADEYRGIGEVSALASWGPNGFETYAIHQLEPIMMLIHDKPQRVMYVPGAASYTLTIMFEGGKAATLTGFDAGGPFMMNVAAADGMHTIDIKSDYFGNFINNMLRFFETGEGAVPHEETLNIMAVRGAGLIASNKPGTWVDV